MDSNNTSSSTGTTASAEITCIVTIHGIGFQQPPTNDVAGYADELHAHLFDELTNLGLKLSDDPDREKHLHAQGLESVPIYVQSSYPLSSSGPHSREAGMQRLDKPLGTGTDTPLMQGGEKSIAHVALVYSDLEGKGVQVVPTIITLLMVLSSLLLRGNYDRLFHFVKMIWADTHPTKKRSGKKRHIPSLSVRQDKPVQTALRQRRVLFIFKRPQPSPDDSKTIFRQLQNDLAMYICSNEMREQIRSFVRDALLRLASRKDVMNIVINAHSNGTAMAFDTIGSLPTEAASKIKAVITAGSPLRKYTTLFNWGQVMDMEYLIPQWKNFWDERDPAADPLKPCFEWLRCEDLKPNLSPCLYWVRDPVTGDKRRLPIEDNPVDNAAHIDHDQGLVAHNYWDNIEQFIKPVCAIVENVVNNKAPTPIANLLPNLPT